MNQEPLLVLTTAGSLQEAKRLAQALLRERSAGCINIIPQIQSFYWWKSKIERSAEALLLIKTFRSNLNRLAKTLRQEHSYQLPEIIAVPIRWGSKPYLHWLARNVTLSGSRKPNRV